MARIKLSIPQKFKLISHQGENHLVEKSDFPPEISFPPTTFCAIALNL
jgi:hypothetical protein